MRPLSQNQVHFPETAEPAGIAVYPAVPDDFSDCEFHFLPAFSRQLDLQPPESVLPEINGLNFFSALLRGDHLFFNHIKHL